MTQMLSTTCEAVPMHAECQSWTSKPKPCLIAAQDEREQKRQRRKQSNRESARRSRLRKQAECETLAIKVKELDEENIKLKETLRMLEAQLAAVTAKPQPA